MKYVTITIALCIALYFIFCFCKQMLQIGKLKWRDIKVSLLGIAVALLIIDQAMQR